MPVRHLTLTGFRSYEQLQVELGEGPQVVVGPNAAGKTNLIEALVVLSTGRSHRTSTDAEMVRWGAGFARLVVRVGPGAAEGSETEAFDGDELEVVLYARGSAGQARKRVRVNGVNRRSTALRPALRTVTFAPEDMLLIVGSPALRRGALDQLVVQREPGASSAMSTYSRGLTQRNSLLRRIREDGASRDELPYWDQLVCEHGGRIRAWREAAVDALAGPLADAHREIAPEEPPLELRSVSNVVLEPGEDHEAALRRRLVETAEKEIWNGATLVGPHRDDLAFGSEGRDLAEFASRGQQRTAILALKLAELDLLGRLDGRPPLLLLDDVFSELDPARRAHLVRRVGELPQAIVTTTTPADLDPELVAASRLWVVEPGSVRPAERVPV